MIKLLFNEIRKRNEIIKHLRAEKAELYKQLQEIEMYNKTKIYHLKKTIEEMEKIEKGVSIYA